MGERQKHTTYLAALKPLLKKQHIKQVQLAAALGTSQAAVSNWAIGKRNPTCEMLPKIANILGCSIDDLFRQQAKIN